MTVVRLAPNNSEQESIKLQQALLLYPHSGQWGLRAKLVLESCGVPLLDGYANIKTPPLNSDSIVYRCGFDSFYDFICGPLEYSGMGFKWETWTKRVCALLLSERYSISPEHTPPRLINTLNVQVTSHLERDAVDAAEWHATSKLLQMGELRLTVANLERSLEQSKGYLRLVMTRNLRLNRFLGVSRDQETSLRLELDVREEEVSDLNKRLSSDSLVPAEKLEALKKESSLREAALVRKLDVRTEASRRAIAHILERCEALEAAVHAAQDATRLAAAREAELREMTDLRELETLELEEKNSRLKQEVEDSLNLVQSAEIASRDAQATLKAYSGDKEVSALSDTIDELSEKLAKKDAVIRHIAEIQGALQKKVKLRGRLVAQLVAKNKIITQSSDNDKNTPFVLKAISLLVLSACLFTIGTILI